MSSPSLSHGMAIAGIAFMPRPKRLPTGLEKRTTCVEQIEAPSSARRQSPLRPQLSRSSTEWSIVPVQWQYVGQA